MSHSPALASTISNTRMRTPDHVSPFSGMCAVCSATCAGPCEIGLSAVRGAEALLPFQTDISQFASEKDYPLDFSSLAINGRVFGAEGCPADPDMATFPKVATGASFGVKNSLPIQAPFILPAMAKLNWQDYFAGAALAGVPVVIGEDVIAKDKGLVLEHGKVAHSPLIAEMVQAFRQYHRGLGDIILQANWDDEALGVLDYAIVKLGVRSVELKFGQAAKGIQGYGRVSSLEDAIKWRKMGYLVHPDPLDPAVVERHEKGFGPAFEKIGRLPMWDEEMLVQRVDALRRLGAERICFKTGPYDLDDLARILKIASRAGVDLVTFDGAGGGTGNSPVKMMNEWGAQTLCLESAVYAMMQRMVAKGMALPQVAIAGGFATEDQVFKALSLGAPYIGMVALGRSAMAAAMAGKVIGDAIRHGNVPKDFARFGAGIEEIFVDMRELKGLYGTAALEISTGAVGLYSYLNRVTTGLRQLMALNRKFSLACLSRADVFALTREAAQVTGLDTFEDRLGRVLESF